MIVVELNNGRSSPNLGLSDKLSTCKGGRRVESLEKLLGRVDRLFKLRSRFRDDCSICCFERESI